MAQLLDRHGDNRVRAMVRQLALYAPRRYKAELNEVVRPAFQLYAETRDPRLRDQLGITLRLVAEYYARIYVLRGGFSYDEVLSAALYGLAHAIDRYNSEFEINGVKGVSFSTYAEPVICGSIKRLWRNELSVVRPPRSAQNFYYKVMSARNALQQQTGRTEVSLREIAQHLGESEQQVIEKLQVVRRCWNVVALDAPISSGTEVRHSDILGHREQGFDAVDNYLTITRAMSKLPQEHRVFLELYFWHDLSRTEIAQRMGRSRTQVAVVLDAALAQLREALAGAM